MSAYRPQRRTGSRYWQRRASIERHRHARHGHRYCACCDYHGLALPPTTDVGKMLRDSLDRVGERFPWLRAAAAELAGAP